MKKLFLFIIYLFGVTFFAQNSDEKPLISKIKTDKLSLPKFESTIDVRINNAPINEDLQILFDFENINKSEFSFSGKSIKGKFYIVKIKEYANGKLTNIETLFDERGTEFFRIDSTETSFNLLTKVDKNDIKVWIIGKRFGSKQVYCPTTKGNGRYVAKDFFGAKDILKKDSKNPFELMAIITPNRSEDGSGSYCRVAQSEVNPADFGKVFNIPHYFLIEIEFTE